MKEIIKITFALTISCMIAASAMGLTYTVTAKAKKHNHHMNVYNAMVGLLGFGEDNPVPSDLKFLHVYRYIVEDGDKKSTFAQGAVTLEYSCLSCHASRDKKWASKNAKKIH